MATHEVINQPPPFEDVDLFESDAALREGLEREGGGWAEERVRAFGVLAGSAGFMALGEQANRHSPVLRTHDRYGHRIDEVDFHPAWDQVMTAAMATGFTTCPGASPGPARTWRAAA